MPRSNKLTITLDKPSDNIYQVGEVITGTIHHNNPAERLEVDVEYSFRCRLSSETARRTLRIGQLAEDCFDIFRHTTSTKMQNSHSFRYLVPSILSVNGAAQDVYDARSEVQNLCSTSWTETRISHAPPSINLKCGGRKWAISYIIEARIKSQGIKDSEPSSMVLVEISLATSHSQAPQALEYLHETSQFNLQPSEIHRKLSGTHSELPCSQMTHFDFPDIHFVLVSPAYIAIGEPAKVACQWKQLSQPEWPSTATITVYLRFQLTENICCHWGLCETITDHQILASNNTQWTRFCGWYADKITGDSLVSELQPLRIGNDFCQSFRAKLCCEHWLEVDIKIVVKMPSNVIDQSPSRTPEYSKEYAIYTDKASHRVVVLDKTFGARFNERRPQDSSSALPAYHEEVSPPQYDSLFAGLNTGLPPYEM